MAVKLSDRLMALAGLVTPGNRLADVGTDHGYIPVYLCQTEVIPSAIAMDINQGPLRRAEAHITEFGLRERIQTRLSDGLEKLLPGEVDTVLIAGMGGGLMQRILTRGMPVLEGVSELILQPQSEIPQTRKFVREQGFVIVDEQMVEEDGKFYPMMKVHRITGETVHLPKTDESVRQWLKQWDAGGMRQKAEDTFGPILLQKKDAILLKWMERELGITDAIRQRLQEQMSTHAANAKLELRLREMDDKRKLLADTLAWMRGSDC